MKLIAGLLAALVAGPAVTQDPSLPAFRALYEELVETNTTVSAGSCTLAAERMAARMKTAGFTDGELTIFSTPEHPKHGGLVAVLPGRDPKAKAIMLLAHIDVVEAKREDWERDPFTLVEENGYFYARGASDDKAQAAIWVDSLIRFRQSGFKPRRTVKMALTCGEEGGPFNGAQWLTENRRELIDAEFALNEGAGGQLTPAGKRVAHTVLAGEKTSQSFRLEARNAGGHSSRPTPDNAIYQLAGAVDRIGKYDFPVQVNDTTLGFFTQMSAIIGGEMGGAMSAIAADPTNAPAAATLRKDPAYRAVLGTTCVATQLEAGHAPNALPQRAAATINCRIFPGVSRAAVREELIRVIADPNVTVSEPSARAGSDAGPPLTPRVMGPIRQVSEAMCGPGRK